MHFKGFQPVKHPKPSDMTFLKTSSEHKYKSEDTVSQAGHSPCSLNQNPSREGELMLTDGINTILKEKDQEQVGQSS